MLTQLTITNFAIIDSLEIIFNNGLTVLTGETGAGKSIIIDALDFLLGSRGNVDLIKTGTNKLQVEGSFSIKGCKTILSWFEKNGLDSPESNIITVSRELTSQGSKARINGSLVNVSHLLYLREFLLDIHQQSEHIELLKIEKQSEILDIYGGDPHKKTIEEYQTLFKEYITLKALLNNYLQNSLDIAKQVGSLEFEINEIKSARIRNLSEDNELQAKKQILLNKKELIDNSGLIQEIISSENQSNLLNLLSQTKKLVAKSSKYDTSFERYIGTIETIINEIKELSSFISSYSESFDRESENNLEEVEERLDFLYKLKKKYGDSLEKIQEYCQEKQCKLSELQKISSSKEELEESFKQKDKEVSIAADRLTKSREKITKSFVDKINEELLSLGFKQALFVIEFTECETYEGGKEQIQFLFSANPDEPPKSLLKVASGGELSRIMLALKAISPFISKHEKIMIFDEIDIGISGEVASSVAKKLYKISRNSQVICITHQPIICAMADNHFVIEKRIKEGITEVSVKEINESEKTDALATLLNPDKKSKDNVSTDAKLFAKSLIENALKIKEKELFP